MSLKISERSAGDVTILDCAGHLTDTDPFHGTIQRLLALGKSRLLLNISELTYINSAGIGELVSAFTGAANHGGTVKLLNATKRVQDLLQITKLYTVFESFDSEEIALRSFHSKLLYCRCPVCGLRSGPPCFQNGIWPPQTCTNCDSQFHVEIFQGSAQHLRVEFVRIRSYQDEGFEVRHGPPHTIRLIGRLSLFSLSALQRAWRAVPAPRSFLFELQDATEIDGAAIERLKSSLHEQEESARVAVCLEGLPQGQISRFPKKPPFFGDRAGALIALGDVSDTPPWLTQIV
jgi:anti-sigma B factor antagonist